VDGEMIKVAARYVGTGTIIRHMEARARLQPDLEKEAGWGDTALSIGKKLISRPKTLAKGFVSKAPTALQEGLIGDPAVAGKRFLRPIAGLSEGWRAMSGTASRAKSLADKKKTLASLKGDLSRATGDRAEALQKAIAKQTKQVKEYEQASAHLAPNATPKGLAERLSRAGWTGQGQYTKYLPLSQKAMMTGFAASEIPGIVNAPAATRTGEGGRLERLGGALGGTAGWIASTGGVGLIPAMAIWMAAQKAGTSVGRIADRMRAGATLGEAATAPSPQEAREQLAKIYQTYGG
jgi:hypothetical protein